MFPEYYFRSKKTRDAVAKKLRDQGTAVKLRSHRGCVISPDAVQDAFTDGRTRDSYSPDGYGGLSATYWGVLYSIETNSRY